MSTQPACHVSGHAWPVLRQAHGDGCEGLELTEASAQTQPRLASTGDDQQARWVNTVSAGHSANRLAPEAPGRERPEQCFLGCHKLSPSASVNRHRVRAGDLSRRKKSVAGTRQRWVGKVRPSKRRLKTGPCSASRGLRP
jgi:hypothetical protein